VGVSFDRLRSIAWILVINIAISAALLEVALRAQQRLGPLYDLAIGPETIPIGLSEELNHVPVPGPDWESNGVRKMDEPNAANCGPRILFMGDSFMQGFGKTESVPYHVRRYFKQILDKDLCVFNAGDSAYSPSVFVPQAKKLIPELKPDFVVIEIDDLDIWHDYYRYRDVTARDTAGSIVALRSTPIERRFHEGLVESTSKLLYMHRLLAKLYFTRIEYPRLFEDAHRNRPADGYWLQKLPADVARARHLAEIEYFKRVLADLTETVETLAGGSRNLIYIHHPHLENLIDTGIAFNDVTSSAVQEIASLHHVKYYELTEDLRREFGSDPRAYYVPNDMHLNPSGLRVYGIAVAKYLAKIIDPK
jgi:hypothetical protein